MLLKVEIDSRETCFATINQCIKTVRLIEKNVWLSCLSDPTLGKNVIRLGKEFASSLGLNPGETVDVQTVGGEPIIVSSPILLRPATVEDWEVIESMASFLEETILDQISVISPNLIFPVWIARGQKPVYLQHYSLGGDSNSTNAFYQMGPTSELAIEQRTHVAGGEKQRKKLHVRVAFSTHQNEGMIVNESDFADFVGCIVTVRDRPELVSLVTANSNLCDPGVVVVSELLREKYELTFGKRIILEEFDQVLNSSLIIPTRVSLFSTNSASIQLFKDQVLSKGPLVVAQGGWIGHTEYMQVRFGMGLAKTDCIALITAKDLANIVFDHNQLVNESSTITFPYLKYIPEKVSEDSKKFQILTDDMKYPDSIIPSFVPIVNSMREYIDSCFAHADPSLPFVGSGIVLAPHQGAGATTVAMQIISTDRPYVYVNCGLLSDFTRYKMAEVKSTLAGLIRFAFETPPMIILFDRIDLLLPEEGSEIEENRGIFLSSFFENLISQLRPNRSFFLLATAVRDSPTLASLFVHAERLPRDLSETDREFLCEKIAKTSSNLGKYVLSEFVELLNLGVDNREIRKQLMSRGRKSVVNKKMQITLGGMDSQISQLIDAIMLPIDFPFLFTSKQTQSTGALVVGPTGCGKSALVDHIVRKTNLPVEVVRGPDLLDKYIGASEEGVRRVFEKAAAVAPSILVFDTVDALCPRRGSESTGVTDRVVNQMLCYLDGVEKLEGVFVIAITSRPDMVDPALMRPGRLDMVVVCDIPTLVMKEEIIKACWQDHNMKESANFSDLANLVHPNCTGADIRAAFTNATIDNKGEPFETTLRACLAKLKPSISESEAKINTNQLRRYEPGTRAMLH